MTRPLNPPQPIVIVDDELHALRSTEALLLKAGLNNVVLCQDSRELEPRLAATKAAAVLLDLSMPHLPGMQLLPVLIETCPETPVIVVTGANDVQTAVDCMKLGVFDYVLKPVDETRLLSAMQRALEFHELRDENQQLRRYVLNEGVLQHPGAFAEIITNNSAMLGIFRYIEIVAKTVRPVLVTGETGVGKELFARAIHTLSGRSGPFTAVNVAGLDDGVFSDTIFGHVRGAFTGADETRKGLTEQTRGGTLFLDEIGDLNNSSQVKLLRLVQSGEYYPVGSDVAKWADVRIVVATNCDLQAMLDDGRFRRDLYHRLQTHHIHIPPLRKRLDDLPFLLDHFLERAAHALGKKPPTPPKELLALLSSYAFPGNVRELESMVFDAVSMHASKVLSMGTFKAHIDRASGAARLPSAEPVQTDHANLYTQCPQLPTLKAAVDLLVAEALERAHGNQSVAARLLGTTRSALNKRLNKGKE